MGCSEHLRVCLRWQVGGASVGESLHGGWQLGGSGMGRVSTGVDLGYDRADSGL